MVFGLGPMEFVIVAVVLVLLFGVSKLPTLANGVGKTLRQFRRGVTEDGESGSSQ